MLPSATDFWYNAMLPCSEERGRRGASRQKRISNGVGVVCRWYQDTSGSGRVDFMALCSVSVTPVVRDKNVLYDLKIALDKIFPEKVPHTLASIRFPLAPCSFGIIQLKKKKMNE